MFLNPAKDYLGVPKGTPPNRHNASATLHLTLQMIRLPKSLLHGTNHYMLNENGKEYEIMALHLLLSASF